MTDKIYIYSITSDQRKIPFQSKHDYFSEESAQRAAVEYADSHFSKDTGVHIVVTELDEDSAWVVLREDYLMEVQSTTSSDELISLMKTKVSFTPWEIQKILPVISAYAIKNADNINEYATITYLGEYFKELVVESGLTKEEEEEMISIDVQITEGGNYTEADVKRYHELKERQGVSQC